MKRSIAALFALLLLLAACGNDDDGAADIGAGDATENDDDASGADGDATDGDATDDEGETGETGDDGSADEAAGSVKGVDGGPDDFTPASRQFRIINLSEQAVDVYGTTQGVVEEYEVLLDVQPGDVTDYLQAPDEGKLVLFEAGTDDVTGFDNPTRLREFSAGAFPENGDAYTIVLSTSAETDEFDAVDLWESPTEERPAGNALAAPVAGKGTLIMMAEPEGSDSFKPALPGAGECLLPRGEGQENIFVGGTAILAFDFDPGEVTFGLHSFDDQDYECTDTPALEGVTFDIEDGVRTLVVLTRLDGGDVEVQSFPLG